MTDPLFTVIEQQTVTSRIERHYRIQLPTGDTVEAFTFQVNGTDENFNDSDKGLLNPLRDLPKVAKMSKEQREELEDFISSL